MNHGTRGAAGTEYRGGKRTNAGNALTSDIEAPMDVVWKMRYRDKWEQTSDSAGEIALILSWICPQLVSNKFVFSAPSNAARRVRTRREEARPKERSSMRKLSQPFKSSRSCKKHRFVVEENSSCIPA